MRVWTLAAGPLMAIALAAPMLMATAPQADPTGTSQPETGVELANFLVEGPYSTLAACTHRAEWWDHIDGRDHYCVHQLSGGYTPGWYVWAWS
jgi:hypothetical protein